MDRIASLTLLVGISLSFAFYIFWDRIHKKQSFVRDSEWFGLYLLNFAMHTIIQVLVFHKDLTHIQDSEIFSSAAISFSFYFIFARLFLVERIFQVRVLFLVLMSGVYLTGMKLFFSGEVEWFGLLPSDGWNSLSLFLSGAGFTIVGLVFLDKEEKKIDESFSISLVYWVTLFLGILHFGILGSGVEALNNMDIFHALSLCLWCMSISGLVSWLVHRLSGRAYSEDYSILLGLLSGFSAFSGLPMGASLGNLALLSFVAGLFPAVMLTTFLKYFSRVPILGILLGLGWGSFIGYLSYDVVNYPDRSSYESLVDFPNRGLAIIIVLFISMVLGWIGVGLGILLDLAFPTQQKDLENKNI